MMIKLSIIFLALSLSGCFSFNNKEDKKQISLGERNINYYSDKTVTSLEIPPDLTKPSSQNAFKLSKYVTSIQEDTISFSDKDNAIN